MGICPRKIGDGIFAILFAVEDTASSSDNAWQRQVQETGRKIPVLLFACHCGQLKRCGVTGQFSPMKFLVNCLTPSKQFGKKETLSASVKFDIVSTDDPKISVVQTSLLLIIATIG